MYVQKILRLPMIIRGSPGRGNFGKSVRIDSIRYKIDNKTHNCTVSLGGARLALVAIWGTGVPLLRLGIGCESTSSLKIK
jgi:hypothetical protein